MNAGKVGGASSADTQKLLGTKIDGKYQLLSVLGHGGMGSVFRAKHIGIDRDVVVKLLHRHLTLNDPSGEFLERFRREAQLASQIEHQNAVTVYDFGDYEGQPYLVMQYNRGRTLKAALKEEGAISAERAIRICAQVCEALAAAHKLGIVHRDIKPDNIMLHVDEGEERAQVLDFGLAKAIRSQGSDNDTLTQTGVAMGTPRYMAPEQAIASELDARTDIYSLGIVLYEMLTGDVPFVADTAMKVMMKHIKEKAVRPSEKKPGYDIPSSLDNAVMKALKKEPANRFQSALEMRDELLLSLSDPEPAKSAAQRSIPTDVANEDTPAPRGIRVGSILGVLILLTGIGAISHPLMVYFSPEEMARRAALEERHQKIGKHLALAEQFEEAKDYDAAVYELKRALDVMPDDADLYYRLGNVYAKSARIDQAMVVYENAIEHNAKFADAYFKLGLLQAQRGQRQQALSTLRTATEIDPDNQAAVRNYERIKKLLTRKRLS